MKIKNKTVTVSGAVCGLILAGYGVQAQNLFVGDYQSESILEFSGGTQTTFATGMNYPNALAFDRSGDLFEADQGTGNIYEWAGTGKTRTTFASGLGGPSAMVFNAAGDLFVNANSASIDEFNSSGSIINTYTGFNQASGLAIDSAGNLYIGSINGGAGGAGTITEITPKGVTSTFASGLNYPVGMTFNAAGDLLVTGGNGYGTITEITPAGSESLYASGLNQPIGLAFDGTGDLFVADGGLNSGPGDITEFAVNGTRSVFSSSAGKPLSLAFEPVPEPSAYAFFGLGLLALVLTFCKKRQAAQA